MEILVRVNYVHIFFVHYCIEKVSVRDGFGFRHFGRFKNHFGPEIAPERSFLEVCSTTWIELKQSKSSLVKKTFVNQNLTTVHSFSTEELFRTKSRLCCHHHYHQKGKRSNEDTKDPCATRTDSRL